MQIAAADFAAFDIDDVASRIGMEVKNWPGNCYAVSCKLIKAGVIDGRPAYGNYHGEIAATSRFHNRPVVRHGWIVRKDGMIVDPTRWVFESVPPYIFVGPPSFEYDEGANLLRAANAKPAPVFDPAKPCVHVPSGEACELFAAILGLDEVRSSINMEQAFWLGNCTPQLLGKNAKAVYEALDDMHLKAFIPTDNFKMVVEHG